MLQQCVSNEVPTSSTTSNNNMFDIQLNYDVDQALDSEEWDSDFHATSLHRAMEHLASNIKNIKDFLQRIEKYIQDKSTDNNPNNIKNLRHVEKAA